MLHILVPTDFSDLSKVAIRYALDMAKKMNGKVTLLHVVDTGQYGSRVRLRLNSMINEVLKIAHQDFASLLKEVNKMNRGGKPVKYAIEQGTSFVDTVAKFAKKNKANLIIMGTHGASGIKKLLMGSNTVSMLEASSIPVLAIPPGIKFKKLRSVVYASDLMNIQKEFKKLLGVVGSENPIIHIIHVSEDRRAATLAEERIDKVAAKSDHKNVVVRVLINDKAVPAISEYVTKIKVDMLIMFPHRHSFFEKLTKPSITNQLSFLNNAPLLAFSAK